MGRFCDGGVRYGTSFFQESLDRCDAVRLCLYEEGFYGSRIRDAYNKDLSSESANQRLSLLNSPPVNTSEKYSQPSFCFSLMVAVEGYCRFDFE
jgi:hypothetical protein